MENLIQAGRARPALLTFKVSFRLRPERPGVSPVDREEHFRRANSLGESLRQKSVCRVPGMSRAVKNWGGGSPLSIESPERLASPAPGATLSLLCLPGDGMWMGAELEEETQSGCYHSSASDAGLV